MYLPFYRHQLRDEATGTASELVTAFLWLKTLPKFYFAVYCAHPLRIALVLGHLSAYALLARGVLAGLRSYHKPHSRLVHKVRMVAFTILMMSTGLQVAECVQIFQNIMPRSMWTNIPDKLIPIEPPIGRMLANIPNIMLFGHLMAP